MDCLTLPTAPPWVTNKNINPGWDTGRYCFYVPAEHASGKGMKSLLRNLSIYMQLQRNHSLLFIAWVKPFISWVLRIWVFTYCRQNRHFVLLAAASCILRYAPCSLRFPLLFSLVASFSSLKNSSNILFVQETMTYTRATMNILLSASNAPYAYFA